MVSQRKQRQIRRVRQAGAKVGLEAGAGTGEEEVEALIVDVAATEAVTVEGTEKAGGTVGEGLPLGREAVREGVGGAGGDHAPDRVQLRDRDHEIDAETAIIGTGEDVHDRGLVLGLPSL